MKFITDNQPTKSGVYLVHRGEKLGKWYRYFDADAKQWGDIDYQPTGAFHLKGKPSVFGFLPWFPLWNVDNGKSSITTEEVVAKITVKELVKPKAKVASTTKAKVATSAKTNAYPNGTVFYREDRNKWVAVWNGVQEAARPTKEACLKFLLKKYNVQGNVI